jgi:hypothetical protein
MLPDFDAISPGSVAKSPDILKKSGDGGGDESILSADQLIGGKVAGHSRPICRLSQQ